MYSQLSKARLSALVVASTVAGFAMAGPPLSLGVLGATTVGTFLCAASANTFNQVYERDYDARMFRTAHRPLPSGRISVAHATGFGLAAGLAGTGLLAVAANPLTAALGLGNIVLYAGAYTPLKQRTSFNTTVGAIVGAIPPLMGWAAATGGLAAAAPWALATLLFAWQYPHFLALSWMCREDYQRGGYKMHAVLDPSGSSTAALAWRGALVLGALPVAMCALGETHVAFGIEALLINAVFLRNAWRFYRDPTHAKARGLFLSSLWYLPLVMLLMVAHASTWGDDLLLAQIGLASVATM